MNQFWRLTRLQLKLTFGLASLKAQIKSGGKERLKAIASLVMIVLLCGGLLTGYLWLLNWLFDLVVLNTIQDTLLAMSIIAGMLVVFVFGIPYAFSLYYAKDIPFLASMPIKQSTVFASKFVSSLIGELGTFSLFVVPTFIIYATHMQVTAQYIFSALVITLLGAMIPFALVNLVVALLMHLTIFTRHRDKFATVFGFIFLLVYLVGVQALNMAMQNMTADQMIALLSGGLLDRITRVFPPARWAASALVYGGNTGLFNLLLFAAVCLVCFAVCYFVAGHLYHKGAAAQEETAVRSKKVNLKTAGAKVNRPIWAIFVKEWKGVLRSPTYAMNGLISVIMAPLMVVMMKIAMPVQEVFYEVGMPGLTVGDIYAYLPKELLTVLMLLIIGFGYFFAAMNLCAMTVYSREGESCWLLMVLPISPKTQLRGKILFSMSITFLAALLMGIALLFAWQAPWWLVLLVVAAITLMSAPVVLLGIFIDLRFPKLHWDSERRAMKSNGNTLLGMLAELVYLAVMVLLVFVIDDLMAYMAVAAAISLLCTVGLYIWMMKAVPALQAKMMEA